MAYRIIPAAVAVLIAGCGAQHEQPVPVAAAPTQLLSTTPASLGGSSAAEVTHTQTVALLYLAYFGRPADPGGQTAFSAQLSSFGLPDNIEQLDQAYGVNVQVRALVNSFANSAESTALYTAKDNIAFVSTVYDAVLGRQPDLAGLQFWVGALDRGELTRAKVAMSIAAAATKNTSAQGLLDSLTVRNRLAFAAGATAQMQALGLIAAYVGDQRAAAARAWVRSVDHQDTAESIAQKISWYIANLKDELYCSPQPCAQVFAMGDYAATAPAAATRQWEAGAQELDTFADTSSTSSVLAVPPAPVLVVDIHGTVTAFWQRSEGGPVWASRRTRFEENWSAPQQLAPQAAGERVSGVNAVTSPNGSVAVAWQVRSAEGAALDQERTMVARLTGGAPAWTVTRLNAAQSIPVPGSAPQLAVDDNGVITAVTVAGSASLLFVNRFDPASDSWSAPTVLGGTADLSVAPPVVAAAKDGAVVIAWVQTPRAQQHEVKVVRYEPRTNTWSEPELIDNRLGVPALALAWDEASGFTLTYAWAKGSAFPLAATRLGPRAQAWTPPVQISADQPFDAGVAGPGTLVSAIGGTAVLYENDGAVDVVRSVGTYAPWFAPRAVPARWVGRDKAAIGIDVFGNINVLDMKDGLHALRFDAASNTWTARQSVGGAFGSTTIDALRLAQVTDQAGVVTAVWIAGSPVSRERSWVLGSKRFR